MKQLSLLLSFLFAFPTFAFDNVEIDGLYYDIFPDDGTAVLVAPTHPYSGAVVVPAQVQYKDRSYRVTAFEPETFWNATALTSVVVPEGVQVLPTNCFFGCRELSAVHLPEGLTTIEENVFFGCKKLTSITLPERVERIKEHAFGDSGLQQATLPESLVELGEGAFVYCYQLQTVKLPSKLKSIGNLTFLGCTALRSIVIPEGVQSVGLSAFWKCTSLESIVFPRSLKEIGAAAFLGCTSLTELHLPVSVYRLGDGAFSMCPALKRIVVDTPIPPVFDLPAFDPKAKIFDSETLKSAICLVPRGYLSNYQTAAGWSDFATIREQGEVYTALNTQPATSSAPLNVYDLQGKRIAVSANGLRNLSSGIYIVNGRKQLVP